MANHYSQFSEGIKDITPEEATWIKDFLRTPYPDEEEDPKGFKQWCEERRIKEGDEPDWYPSFQWALEDKDTFLWFYTEEGCDIDYLVYFVQSFLTKFRPDYIFTATGAEYCSKLRIGEFGGWWVVVTAKKVLWGSTYDSVATAVKKIEAARKRKRKKK
jgi:hypothetical protein